MSQAQAPVHRGRPSLERPRSGGPPSSEGFGLLELLVALAISLTIAAVAVPLTAGTVDELQAGMAARYLAGRVADARMHAVKQSARVGFKFEEIGDDYAFTEYVDGNGNGIRSADIAARRDSQRVAAVRLADSFPRVTFGLRSGVPEVEGEGGGDRGGVRVGAARILTMGPDGTSTSGTLYVKGARAQYAVRIFGATGRTRVMRFDSGSGQWAAR